MTDSTILRIGYDGTWSSYTVSPLRVKARGGVTRWIYSSLFRFDETGELVGDLVDGWSLSDDGLTYFLQLRGDVVWHDGTQLTSRDVVFTGSRLQEENRAFRNSMMVQGEMARFSAVDDLTVRVDLAGPSGNFLSYLTPVWGALFLVVPAHIIEDIGEDEFEKHPIGTGPFRFGGISDRETLVLEANDSYMDGRPGTDRVEVQFFRDNDARVGAFERGDIDVLIMPGREYSRERAEAVGGRLYATPTNTIVQMAMNCRNPLFGTVATRQAVACAIDRLNLVARIEGPDGIPAFSPIGPLSWAYAESVETHPYNPDRARQLLSDDNWAPGDDGILTRSGERFEFSILFPPGTWNYELARYADGISEYLAAVGISARPKPVDYWTTLKSAWRDQSFEAFIYYDTFYVEPDLYWSWHSSMPRRPSTEEAPSALPQYGYGATGYINAEVDRLIESYRASRDRDRQKEMLVRAQEIMAEEVASLWLYNHQWKNAVSTSVGGLSAPGISDGTSDLVVLLNPANLTKDDNGFRN